jgi:4-hydroxy-tetrahydrodipicolinate synthase
MLAAAERNDIATAREVYRRLLPAVAGIMTRAPGAVMAKAALELAGVLPGRAVRLPLLPADDAQVSVLRDDLRSAGVVTATAAGSAA